MSTSFKVRNAITKLRISGHSLPIEKGHYKNLPRENRLCTYCKTESGDEFHCLFKYFNPKLQKKIKNKYLSELFHTNQQ